MLGLSTRIPTALPLEAEAHPPLAPRAAMYIRITAALAVIVFAVELVGWESPDLLRFLAFFAIAILASGMRINVPGLTGTLSLTFLFVLFGLIELTPSETILMASVMTLIQCYWRQQPKPRAAKVLFNVASMIIATAAANGAYASSWLSGVSAEPAARLAWATIVFFLANTAPVALVISLTESKPFPKTWLECDFWAF